MKTTMLLNVVVLLLTSALASAATRYVPSEYTTIQAAIDDSNDSDVVIVAPGTYTDDGNRDIDFKGKAITVRSENGPETCIIDCNGSQNEPHRGFYFHNGEDANSILNGFTITNGFASQGGGICCDASSPTINNCKITGNETEGFFSYGYDGGGTGICCRDFSNPTITDCIINGNIAHFSILHSGELANGKGVGISCFGSSPTIRNCIIIENVGAHGGGIYCFESNPMIIGCEISDNRVVDDGGGISCYNSNPTISNCLISGNTGWDFYGGGGVYCYESSPTIASNTITGNIHQYRGGAICGYKGSSPTITNCILWNNTAIYGNEICLLTFEYYWGERVYSTATVRYSDVRGGAAAAHVESGCTLTWENGNSDTEPGFVELGHWDANGTPQYIYDDFWVQGDYHLKSRAGRWDTNSKTWVQDDVISPCIDAGDMDSPIGYEPSQRRSYQYGSLRRHG